MPASLPSSRARRALVVFFTLAATTVVGTGCDEPAAPEPRFDLVDTWLGTFRGEHVAFDLQVVVEVEADGRLTGFATGWSGHYGLTGRYEPPTVYLRMTTETDTLAFLGEVAVGTFLAGTLRVDSESLADQAGILLARR